MTALFPDCVAKVPKRLAANFPLRDEPTIADRYVLKRATEVAGEFNGFVFSLAASISGLRSLHVPGIFRWSAMGVCVRRHEPPRVCRVEDERRKQALEPRQ